MDGRAGKRRSRGDDERDIRRTSGEFLGHGVTFAAATLFFLWLGHEADIRLGTDPLLALTGMMLGASAGFWSLYARVTEAGRRGDDPGEKEAGGEPDDGKDGGG